MSKPNYTIEFTPRTHWWYRWSYEVRNENDEVVVWNFCHSKKSGRREARRVVYWRTKSWFRRRENNSSVSKENL